MKLGADSDQLETLSATLATCERRMSAMSTDIGSALAAVSWAGPDRVRFERVLGGELIQLALHLRHQFEQWADGLRAQASAQRRSSAADPNGATGSVWMIDKSANREIFALGNPAVADRVVILVGGIGTSVATFDQQIRRATALFSEVNESESVAVIAWLDYDAPSGFDDLRHLPEALTSARASVGSRRLRAFIDELDRRPDASFTLIGHSYGSLVVTGAARSNPDVDRVVVLGSPGLGVERLDQLDLAAGTEFFAAGARSDPISHIQWFGTDPSSPRFGGTPFDATGNSSRPSPGGDLFDGLRTAHSSYFDRGSDSLVNLARIVRGERPGDDPRTASDHVLHVEQQRIEELSAVTTAASQLTTPVPALGEIADLTRSSIDLAAKTFTKFAGLAEAADDQLHQLIDGDT